MKKLKSGTMYLAFILLMSVFLITGCGGDGGGGTWDEIEKIAPTLIYTIPIDGTTGVPLNRRVSAAFSEEMDPRTITTATFTVTDGVNPITGTVTYDVLTRIALFKPDIPLTINTPYTATVTTGAKDLAGNALAAGIVVNPWSFTTGTAVDATAPTVILTDPLNLAINVPVNKIITATFSEPINPLTIGPPANSFAVKETVSGNPVAGTVSYLGTTATFSPLGNLTGNLNYTATITTVATDLADNPLAADKIWTFQTGTTAHLGPAPVILGATQLYGVLSNTGMTMGGGPLSVTGFRVDGDVGISPAGACVGCDNTTVTGNIENGTVAAADAIVALTAAYNDAIGRTVGQCTLVAGGDLSINPPPVCGGLSDGTFAPGLYWSGTSISIPVGATITLDAQNDPNAVFIFQSESSIGSLANTHVLLANMAQAKNVFWVGKSSATIGGLGADFAGTLIMLTAATVNTNTQMTGRALARGGAVTVQDLALITVPAP